MEFLKEFENPLAKKIARQLYHSFIYSRIDYGIQIYGTCSNTLLDKIQILSNKLLKFLLRLNPRTSTDRLHADLKILKVRDIFEVNILSFVRKCLHGECPTVFNDYFTYPQHNHDFRNYDDKLRVPQTNIDLYENSVKVKGAVKWNNLQNSIKSKANLKSFRYILKMHYINKY